jgi:hypothetical protein
VRRILGVTVLAVAAALAVPVLAQDEKKDTKKEEKAETKPKPEGKEKWVAAGSYSGKLVKQPGENRELTLSIKLRNWENVNFLVHDDVKVRFRQPPPQFDDKGKRRKPTAKELQELRGPDKKLPGYTASLEDLKPGQVVSLQLIRRAGNFKLPKGKDKEAEVPDEYKPQVSVIVIEAEPLTK